MSLGVHIYTSMYFPRKLFLSPVMNPDGGEPVSIPRAPPILLLAFWLWQWGEAGLFIGSALYGSNDLLSLGGSKAASSSSPPRFPPVLSFSCCLLLST